MLLQTLLYKELTILVNQSEEMAELVKAKKREQAEKAKKAKAEREECAAKEKSIGEDPVHPDIKVMPACQWAYLETYLKSIKLTSFTPKMQII